MSSTLLLNQGYMPLATISWRRAITLLFQDKVEVVEVYSNTELRSVSLCVKMPAVVRLVNKIRKKTKHNIKFSRLNIYTRDGWKCQYCNKKGRPENLNLDHVTPKSRGGTTCWENIVTSCIPCNTKKRDRLPHEACMNLKKLPYKPTWLPIFSIKPASRYPNQWVNYMYWLKQPLD